MHREDKTKIYEYIYSKGNAYTEKTKHKEQKALRERERERERERDLYAPKQ